MHAIWPSICGKPYCSPTSISICRVLLGSLPPRLIMTSVTRLIPIINHDLRAPIIDNPKAEGQRSGKAGTIRPVVCTSFSTHHADDPLGWGREGWFIWIRSIPERGTEPRLWYAEALLFPGPSAGVRQQGVEKPSMSSFSFQALLSPACSVGSATRKDPGGIAALANSTSEDLGGETYIQQGHWAVKLQPSSRRTMPHLRDES